MADRSPRQAPTKEERLRQLEHQKSVLLERARSLPTFERNEALRKVILIEDEIARYLTPNK
jgi:hypothetical protein